MSLLWRDHVVIGLSAEDVSIVRRGGIGYRVRGEPITLSRPETVDAHWSFTAHALGDWCGKNNISGCRVTVVLSNSFARYTLMPWTEQLSSRGDEEAFARMLLEKTFGDQVKECTVRVSDAPYGHARICSAVDRRLVSALQQAVSRGGVDTVLVQPLLMSAFNRWRDALAKGTNCLALVERDKALLAFFSAGRWLSIRAVRLFAGHTEAIAQAIARETVVLGLETPPRTYLYSTVGSILADAPATNAVRLATIERNDPSAPQPVSVSLALLGA